MKLINNFIIKRQRRKKINMNLRNIENLSREELEENIRLLQEEIAAHNHSITFNDMNNSFEYLQNISNFTENNHFHNHHSDDNTHINHHHMF